MRPIRLIVLLAWLGAAFAPASETNKGYYREPAIHGDTIVFAAEGDLWRVSAQGGMATRLTTHPGDESQPVISPDGRTIAFVASYEGPPEVYTMPVAGGLPARRTWDGQRAMISGWTGDGRIIFSTEVYSTLPNWQLVLLDISNPAVSAMAQRVPLWQAADGCHDDTGRTLFFTRLAFQGSHTKRYKGGTAQNIWRFSEGDAEATPLTADYPGTSKEPMWWQGRVYFASDRDGTMNLWSMNADGGDLRQHTRHSGFDIFSPALGQGRIVYQWQADLYVHDIATGASSRVDITLPSDFDQTRERWIDKPMDYLTSWRVSPDGDRVALTARGEVFVAPQRFGRLVSVPRKENVRYRDARFMPDGKTLLAMSDESGEVEFWTLPANGVGAAQQLTRDGTVLRWGGVPSPDGKHVAHHDKDQRLFLLNVETRENRLIDSTEIDSFDDLAWSPDSRWLAYVSYAENAFRIVRIYSLDDGQARTITSDRYETYSPAWSADGKWLYVLSDRNLESIVGSPWGNYQPEPYLDKKTKIYHVALTKGLRSPFARPDELHGPDGQKKEDTKDEKKPESPPAETQPATSPTEAPAAAASAPSEESREKPKDEKAKTPEVKIDFDGIAERFWSVPLPPGNYRELSLNDKALFWLSAPLGGDGTNLVGAAISREEVEIKTVLEGVRGYEMSHDGKKLLVRKGDALYVLDAAAAKADLDKKQVALGGWKLSVIPREEWRQMFVEAWRLERDYFYARDMHGVDWKAMLDKYLPFVERVSTRAELSHLIAQMVGELSALHIFVAGGHMRSGPDSIAPASLGALLARDDTAGGYRVEQIYRHDPDEPERASPLARPGADVRPGDVITMVNGIDVLTVPDVNVLLRNQAGKQVLIRVMPASGEPRDAIVEPLSATAAGELRYHEWQLTRRELVEELGAGEIGYVHLRAMGGDNFTEWAKGYYPAFTRKGLIIDVRHNRGGNIDSWILSRLLRKVWFYWNQHAGRSPTWNMQQAFRGHMVVLCNERTASDGEAFSEGFKRLGLGKVIGTRTWGGEIWLSSNNFLVDGGIATSAEYGVFGPDGEWLIEGHGVEPDIVVDNLPHATFKGEDAQLKAAIRHLQQRIAEEPVDLPPVPPTPNKSFRYPSRQP
ncbi:MAG: PDZ domain-containing protein [Phycisphaerae bacterium]|nr:PD40 domain-containing protein [Phycisphaerae bacterium]MCZ2400838.1 PDZ domain-containing protein [Phycisphaerae bacterium]NUQ48750.1 PD40 domain-containing protein [Phycisphaerae bacterium]